MRLAATFLLSLGVLISAADVVVAEDKNIGCVMVARPADVVALRSDGTIGIADKTIDGDVISFPWNSFTDYDPNAYCGPVGVVSDVTAMCQAFLKANVPDECPAELEKSQKKIVAQAKTISRLARENKRLRDMLRGPRVLGKTQN